MDENDNTTMRAVDVLRGARQRLLDKGWCKGTFWKSAEEDPLTGDLTESRCCLLGALKLNSTFSPSGALRFDHNSKETDAAFDAYDASIMALLKTLQVHRGYHEGIPSFNDEPGRTLPEVIALIDDAITFYVGGQ